MSIALFDGNLRDGWFYTEEHDIAEYSDLLLTVKCAEGARSHVFQIRVEAGLYFAGELYWFTIMAQETTYVYVENDKEATLVYPHISIERYVKLRVKMRALSGKPMFKLHAHLET